MGIVSQVFNRILSPSVRPSEDWMGWFKRLTPKTKSGVRVGHSNLMHLSAVWAATNLYTETIASLPRKVMEYGPKNTRNEATKHPAYNIFVYGPNEEMGADGWVSSSINHYLNWGNVFALKERDPYTGRVVKLWPIHPSHVPQENIIRVPQDNSNFKVSDPSNNNTIIGLAKPGTLVYKVNIDDEPHYFLKKDMLHITGRSSDDGIFGQGVLPNARESLGAAHGAHNYAASLWGSGLNSTTIIKHAEHLGPEKKAALKKDVKRYANPKNQHDPFLIPKDTDIARLGLPPEVVQLLESRKFDITEIARWYNIPVHLLRELTRTTFNNIENETLSFLTFSLIPVLTRIERELKRNLLNRKDRNRYGFTFEAKGLLRATADQRAEFYRKMFEIGVYTRDEIRVLEDEPPVGGVAGSTRYSPANLFTVDQAKALEEVAIKAAEQPLEPEVVVEETPSNPEDAAVPQPDKKLTPENMAVFQKETVVSGIKALINDTTKGMADYQKRVLSQKARHPEKWSESVSEFYNKYSPKLVGVITGLQALSLYGWESDELTNLCLLYTDETTKAILDISHDGAIEEVINLHTEELTIKLSECKNEMLAT